MAARVAACTACHGDAGRASRDGYYPRIAGKPAGYLFNQLQSFRDGQRVYAPMNNLLVRVPDAYLAEIANYFARLDPPYPGPEASTLSAAQTERAEQLIRQGDGTTPACTSCHGTALTGTLPSVPGLLGASRAYLNAQLGAWINHTRAAKAPDCMASIARTLSADDVALLSTWLAAQPVPPQHAPAPRPDAPWTQHCGSMQIDPHVLSQAP